MSLFKEKKKSNVDKNKSNSLQTTIESKHNEIVKSYRDLKKTIPTKKIQLNHLYSELEKINNITSSELSEEQISHKFMLKEQISNLEKDIQNIESEQNLKEYILNTGHMLYNYFDDNSLKPNKKTNSVVNNNNIIYKKTVLDFFISKSNTPTTTNNSNENSNVNSKVNSNVNLSNTSFNEKTKGEIMDAYLSLTNKNHIRRVDDVNIENYDICRNCNEQRIFNSIQSSMICPTCGIEEKMLIDSETPSYKEPPREITYFAYKKINHFNEWLSQFQAKESTDIPEEIFEQIENELGKERYLNKKNLKASKVRDILKKLHLTKYYEHCHYITNRITGRPAPEIDEELQEKIRNMFKQIQGPWMRFCPSDRSNLLSYPYIFYKFFQLLGRDEYLSYFRLLKSREKLQEHDEIWKKICNELKWQYIKTV
jgi:hypothetical protein